MTALTKTLWREVDLYGVGPVIVGMEPDKTFTFREKGCHKEYRIPMLTVFFMAIKLQKEK